MMKKFYLCILLSMASVIACAQDSTFEVTITVLGGEGKEPLPRATVLLKDPNRTLVADSAGQVHFKGLKAGRYSLAVSFVGHAEKVITFTLPGETEIDVLLEEEEEEHEEEIIIQATRTSRTIANTPTRTEVISGEELAEKGNMRPGNIQMLLNESTGIQTQVTSATSANASIRIQGLDGRYTQVLRDGLPLYGGFAGGLSIMQIAPLDLRQVEVIKGSSSTLYGGGAIAGLVNLVSKVPTEKREISFLANGSTAGGLDLSGFYAERYGKLGLTVFGSGNAGLPFDPAGLGLTAIPKYSRYTVNPRLFFYGSKTMANVGFSYITEDRTGGSTAYIKNGTPGYFEKNNTDRFTSQFSLSQKAGDRAALNLKNSYTRFNRSISIPGYQFAGVQQSSFTELNYSFQGEKLDWIFGTNLLTDKFNETVRSAALPRDYSYATYGVFVQNQWTIDPRFTLETGLRGDYVRQYGFVLLPRLSAMFRPSSRLTFRVGGGMGYKTPTVFNEESERIQFQGILPIQFNPVNNERSQGANLDINYRIRIGEVGVQFNHMFFFTRLYRPLVLTSTQNGLAFLNANGNLDTRGMETNLRLSYGNFKLFLGYTYADANTYFEGNKEWLPLTARHRLNNVLMFEKEEKLKIGLEAYYFSPQVLNDGAMGKPYWIVGVMGEKMWEKFSVFINLENITDSRQTRFDTIYTGSMDSPTFRDIYAPLEGFVVNGGVKLRL